MLFIDRRQEFFKHRFGKSADDVPSDKEDEGPNFKTSGKLASETNTYKVSITVARDHLLAMCH